MNKQLNRLCETFWVKLGISIIITGIFFFIIYCTSPVVFFINDDENIMYTLAGYYTNGIPGDHSFVNYLLGRGISTLYSWLPSVPWYGVFHVMVLFTSITAIGYTILKESSVRKLLPILAVCLFACITLLCFTFPVTLMQFTVTSAIAGTAAVALLLAGGAGNSILSVVFMVLCYLHRKNTGNVILCFYALTAAYQFLRNLLKKKQEKLNISGMSVLKPVIALVLAVACIFGCVFISESVVRTTDEWDAFYEYDEARFKVTDYDHDSFSENPEMYEQMGWTASLYRLSCSSFLFFMDERINADSFNTISATGYQSTDSSLKECVDNFIKLITGETQAMICLVLIMVLFLLVALLSIKNIKKLWLEVLLAEGAVLGAGVMILYLCWKGRFILRAFQTIAYPTIVILAIVLLRVMGAIMTKKPGKPAIIVGSVLLLVAGLVTVNLGHGLMAESRELAHSRQVKSNRTHAVEEYAIENPENMYIYDTSLTFRYSPFVTYVDAYPSNVSYWGGMGWNSPTLLDQAEQNGIDKMQSDIFFRDDVYYVSYSGYTTGNGTPIKDVFMDYMTETYGDVTIKLVDSITPEIGVYKVHKIGK